MIIPAILESNIKKFNEQLKRVLSLKGIKSVQIDFADGEFVATKTVTAEEIKAVKNKVKFEAHLMVTHPKDFVPYQKCGFSKVILHYESFASERDLEEAIEQIRKLKMIPALAISPTTSISVLRYYTDTISDFTLLGVVPGRQGRKMETHTIDRLRELRDIAPSSRIELDGGVNLENIAELIDAGATDCIVGSALLEGDIQDNYINLLGAIK